MTTNTKELKEALTPLLDLMKSIESVEDTDIPNTLTRLGYGRAWGDFKYILTKCLDDIRVAEDWTGHTITVQCDNMARLKETFDSDLAMAKKNPFLVEVAWGETEAVIHYRNDEWTRFWVQDVQTAAQRAQVEVHIETSVDFEVPEPPPLQKVVCFPLSFRYGHAVGFMKLTKQNRRWLEYYLKTGEQGRGAPYIHIEEQVPEQWTCLPGESMGQFKTYYLTKGYGWQDWSDTFNWGCYDLEGGLVYLTKQSRTSSDKYRTKFNAKTLLTLFDGD